MSGSAPKPHPRLVLAPRSMPTGGATAAAPAAAAPTATASAAVPAARSNIFGAAKPRELVLLEKGVDVQAQKRKLDQRTQQLPRINSAQQEEDEFKESLLASAIATAASENASVVRECVCVRACVCACVRVCVCVRCPCDCTIAFSRAWRARSPSGATPCGRRRLALTWASGAVQDGARRRSNLPTLGRRPMQSELRRTTTTTLVSP
jgi:hypothetical protein